MPDAIFVKRFADAQPYDAPNHRGVNARRLQGFAAGSSQSFWVGLSDIEPGGGAGPDASPIEKVYVVLTGTLTVLADNTEVVLGPQDSCTIPANTVREMINRTQAVVTILVVMPYPPAAP